MRWPSALTGTPHVHVRHTPRLPLYAEHHCNAILPEVRDDALHLLHEQPHHGARLILPSRPSWDSEIQLWPQRIVHYGHPTLANPHIVVRDPSIIVVHLHLDGIG
jgi:hypothetical protein